MKEPHAATSPPSDSLMSGDTKERFVEVAIARHDRGFHSIPASSSGFYHVHVGAVSKRIGDTIDFLVTALTNIVRPARVPLPAFNEAFSLRDHSITNFVRHPHELMMI